ncbi:hypothetical protein PVAP13_2NG023900 [Panicum virgatum]|uniref:Uncharacterized protein n=1 Tax=Panicum virgatum TaxID=38727 RepID=A0A8T0VF15_PANVG|nr:hypothetical protein PVAP13_2NG023900 [Panicum virgatum]
MVLASTHDATSGAASGTHVQAMQLQGVAALTSRGGADSHPGAVALRRQGRRRESRGGGAHVQRIANRSIAVELEGPTKLDDVDLVLNIAIILYLVSWTTP